MHCCRVTFCQHFRGALTLLIGFSTAAVAQGLPPEDTATAGSSLSPYPQAVPKPPS